MLSLIRIAMTVISCHSNRTLTKTEDVGGTWDELEGKGKIKHDENPNNKY